METRSYRHVLYYWPIEHGGDHFSNGCLDFNVRKKKFKLRKITVSEVRKELKQFKSKKTTGVDSI